MTAQFTWQGVPIDPDLLPAYGYNDLLLVNGATLPRFLAYVYAGLVEQQATLATGNATIAATVQSSAAGFSGLSASSLAIGTGAKTFTANTGKSWQSGMLLAATRAADANAYMLGTVTSYNSATGALVLNVLDTRGTGTWNDWVLQLTARQGFQGYAGWAPVLGLVADGVRVVAQVTGWTGGEGAAPATGQYIGASGLVVPIASAVDLRGAPGPAGSGSSIAAQANGAAVTAAPRATINATLSLTAADDAANGRINLALANDTASPGNSMVYGTDSSGNRGWQSGGGGASSLALIAQGIL